VACFVIIVQYILSNAVACEVILTVFWNVIVVMSTERIYANSYVHWKWFERNSHQPLSKNGFGCCQMVSVCCITCMSTCLFIERIYIWVCYDSEHYGYSLVGVPFCLVVGKVWRDVLPLCWSCRQQLLQTLNINLTDCVTSHRTSFPSPVVTLGDCFPFKTQDSAQWSEEMQCELRCKGCACEWPLHHVHCVCSFCWVGSLVVLKV
jgi:hypothetical protein